MKKLLLGCMTIVALSLLAAAKIQAASPVTFYHYDALGSVIATSDQDGRIVLYEEYQPYGEKIYATEDPASGNEDWYTGKNYSKSLDLTYFGARWYDAKQGRFLSMDPAPVTLDQIHSFNRYHYANNNPYSYIDPDGERAMIAIRGFVSRSIGRIKAGFSQYKGARSTPFGPSSKLAKMLQRENLKANKYDKRNQIFERVMNKQELKATQDTKLLRGGRAGENFFTNRASLNAKRTQQRLGLDGPLRDTRIRFRITNDVKINGPRPAQAGRSGTVGGGREYSTTGKTEIQILRIDPLK